MGGENTAGSRGAPPTGRVWRRLAACCCLAVAGCNGAAERPAGELRSAKPAPAASGARPRIRDPAPSPLAERALAEFTRDAPAKGPLWIAVVSRNFGWTYRFPGPDGRLGAGDDLRVDGELHLPLGVDVELLVTSEDNVCTFAVPALGVRKTGVPELVFPVRCRAEKAGVFEVVADPQCGWKYLVDSKHGLVVVEPPEKFAAWLQGKRTR